MIECLKAASKDLIMTTTSIGMQSVPMMEHNRGKSKKMFSKLRQTIGSKLEM